MAIPARWNSFDLSGDVTVDSPVEVDFEHVAYGIDLTLQDKISREMIEEWANLLLSDGYAIAPDRGELQRDRLLQCIHELASPTLFGGSNEQHLRDLKSRCVA